MARVARFVLVDCALHVVQRGINRSACFFCEADYRAYLEYLATFSERFGCSVHAYCLMTNHVHLLLTPHRADACALLMKNLGQHYVQRVNYRLRRSGTLWEGRFHSSLVPSERYVLACYRYIEQNPVRAGMVTSPSRYRWSSYGANAEGKANALVTQHPSYDSLALGPAERTRAYREMCESALPTSDLEEIRKAARIGCAIGARRKNRGRPSKLDEKNGVCPHFSGARPTTS